MAEKILDIAKELGLTVAALRGKVKEMGYRVSPNTDALRDEIVTALREQKASKGLRSKKIVVKKVGKKLEKKVEAEAVQAAEAAAAAAELPPVVEAKPEEPVSEVIGIPKIVTVKQFAARVSLPVSAVITELLRNGIIANINEQIDFETATIIAEDLGKKVELKEDEPPKEAELEINVEEVLKEPDPSKLKPRAPVISVIGHVDHGKTKLLDKIRGTAVAEKEAGGITQRIGAYQVEKKAKDGKIKAMTFLDTPGHEAFTAMRARGVKSTDIAILVVAADDGVMPQTIEAINHAKEAGIPLVVALNKVDKPGANPDRVKQQLAEVGLLVEGWGGHTVCAEISALQGTGIDELLELVLLVADMSDLKANPDRKAIATVIEAHVDPYRGPVATVLINTGTLRKKDIVVIGGTWGRIRTVKNYLGQEVEAALPSMPVQISGIESVPLAGDILQVMDNEQSAHAQAEKLMESRKQRGVMREMYGLSEMTKQVREGALKEFKIVLKADAKGSLEAIRSAFAKIPSEHVTTKIIHSGIGDIHSSDIMIASAGHAAVFGFNVRVTPQVMKQAELEGVQIAKYDVIYKLIEDVQKVLSGMLEPEVVTTELGKLLVLQIFFSGKGEMVVGGKVTTGTLEPKSKARVFREEAVLGEGDVTELRRGPEIVNEVQQGEECGIRFKGNLKLMVNDVLELYKVESRERKLL